MRPTRAAGAALLLAGGALAWPAAAGALPPGGAQDTPGTPAGSLEITTPAGLREGKVQFCVRGSLTTNGQPQQFMLKLDDFGSKGIGPFQPDASGTYCGELATDRAAYATAASANDKLPSKAQGAPADLCDASAQHWLRMLSGSWAGAPGTASERSLGKDLAIDASCGTGGKAAAPSVGSVIGTDTGVGSAPAPVVPGGAPGPGTTPGAPGGSTGPGPGTAAPGTTPPVVTSGLATLRSRTLATTARTVAIRLRRTGAIGGGKLTVRSVSKLRVPGSSGGRRVRTLVAPRSYALNGTSGLTVRARLTATARRILRGRSRLTAAVTLTPTGGKPTTTRVVLRVQR